jgi:hypothetical protein
MRYAFLPAPLGLSSLASLQVSTICAADTRDGLTKQDIGRQVKVTTNTPVFSGVVLGIAPPPPASRSIEGQEVWIGTLAAISKSTISVNIQKPINTISLSEKITLTPAAASTSGYYFHPAVIDIKTITNAEIIDDSGRDFLKH